MILPREKVRDRGNEFLPNSSVNEFLPNSRFFRFLNFQKNGLPRPERRRIAKLARRAESAENARTTTSNR